MIKIQNSKPNEGSGYDESAVNKVRDFWSPNESVSLPGLTAELYGAGHVAGAKMVSVHSEGKTILYTGDSAFMTLRFWKDAKLMHFHSRLTF